MKVSREDSALFRGTVGHVVKIKNQENVLKLPRPQLKVKIRKALREDPDRVDLMSDDPTWIDSDPTAEMRFRREGVSPKLLRQLLQGKIGPDAVIDLHGLTASEARDELQYFLYAALKQNLFCIKIIHGQGYGSKGDPIIRGLIDRWLRLQLDILAFANPPQRMGGRGATLCLLRSQYPFD